MRLLEVVRGAKTDKPVLATAMKLAKQIGKIGVVVGVCHGFVGNRMLAQRQREAQALILEGAMPWDVDRVLHDFGMPMGPFAMSDLAGPRHRLVEGEVVVLDDPRNPVRAGPARPEDRRRLLRLRREPQRQAVAAGREDHPRFRRAEGRSTGATISDEEILERCLYPMVNEGAKILEEGKAQRASDIDIVWINGYGWPVYSGGPMFWADAVGLDKILAAMKGFEAKMGEAFKPAALLEKLVAEGKGFKDL